MIQSRHKSDQLCSASPKSTISLLQQIAGRWSYHVSTRYYTSLPWSTTIPSYFLFYVLCYLSLSCLVLLSVALFPPTLFIIPFDFPSPLPFIFLTTPFMTIDFCEAFFVPSLIYSLPPHLSICVCDFVAISFLS